MSLQLTVTDLNASWQSQLADVITDPMELLSLLNLTEDEALCQGIQARRLFPIRVPRAFAKRMERGNAKDPLLLQVIGSSAEFEKINGFIDDPLEEHNSVLPGLLHKYKNRVLFLLKGGCAVNCRYCFRRHFPYADNKGNKENWTHALDYISQNTDINEVIFSGGDPLMAKDSELEWLFSHLAAIPHIKRLRFHTRFPVVIPARITNEFCQLISSTRLDFILVSHINHAAEIDGSVTAAFKRLRDSGVTLLNQSVLLKGINDDADILANLSNALFAAGILPYYIFTLDKVNGAAHFMIDDDTARKIMHQLLTKVSGYLVPRLAREIPGQASKTPLDLQLRQV